MPGALGACGLTLGDSGSGSKSPLRHIMRKRARGGLVIPPCCSSSSSSPNSNVILGEEEPAKSVEDIPQNTV